MTLWASLLVPDDLASSPHMSPLRAVTQLQRGSNKIHASIWKQSDSDCYLLQQARIERQCLAWPRIIDVMLDALAASLHKLPWPCWPLCSLAARKYHAILYYFILYQITSDHIALHQIIVYCITVKYITLYHFILHCTRSHQIILYYIRLQYIISQ